jgi:5-methylcytosine-specific restriction endonuclease McrA
VLVLNKSWIAINIASVRRALTLLYQGLAKVVSVEEDYKTYDFESWADISEAASSEVIRTVHFQIRVPEVIVLTLYGGLPRREVVLSRKNIFERDNNTCQYCGRKKSREDLTIDHVVPRSRGGKNEWVNLVLACYNCNARKQNRMPADAGMRLVRTPKKPHWVPHIGIQMSQIKRTSWQKFVDTAYWETELKE